MVVSEPVVGVVVVGVVVVGVVVDVVVVVGGKVPTVFPFTEQLPLVQVIVPEFGG